MIDLRLGDCLDIMRGMGAENVDAIVTDPPYGLSFMGKDWDHGVPGVHFWSEALRVAKPGAYLLAFGGTRTYHRLVCAIEDAGFEIRDTIEWVYGSGLPKSLAVDKAIDRAVGAERKTIGRYQPPNGQVWNLKQADDPTIHHAEPAFTASGTRTLDITAPATDAAREWAGWGTALKPAHEPIVVARKPLIGTVVENVMEYGTGALNIDASRINVADNEPNKRETLAANENHNNFGGGIDNREPRQHGSPQGRFPANLITDGSAEVVAMFPQSDHARGNIAPTKSGTGIFHPTHSEQDTFSGDTGSAARFFKSCPLDDDDYPPLYYCAKASKAERDAGCEGIEETESRRYGEQGQGPLPQQTPRTTVKQRNHHPTVKPLSLMRYLITLCTREGATVLDPFMGSGTTGVACAQLGRDFIGCDNVAEYVEIAKRRIEAAQPVAVALPLMVEA